MKHIFRHLLFLLSGIHICIFLYGCATPSPTGKMSKDDIIKKYLIHKKLDPIEGIWRWENELYEVAIIKNRFGIYPQYDFIGIITETSKPGWHIGDTKLLARKTAYKYGYFGLMFSGVRTKHKAVFEFAHTATRMNNDIIGIHLRNWPTKNNEFNIVRMYPGKDNTEDEGSATGFFISPHIIVTNYHVVQDAEKITISFKDKKLTAKLAVKDKINDLALLQIETGTPDVQDILDSVTALPVGSVKTVTEGDRVYAVGYPLSPMLGKKVRVSEGIINSLVGMDDDPREFQISIPIQPGNSGSPLFNTNGQVIGVVSSSLGDMYTLARTASIPQNVNFAVKINYLNTLIPLLPDKIDPLTQSSGEQLTASQLLAKVRTSIVLIECEY